MSPPHSVSPSSLIAGSWATLDQTAMPASELVVWLVPDSTRVKPIHSSEDLLRPPEV